MPLPSEKSTQLPEVHEEAEIDVKEISRVFKDKKS